MVLRNTSSKDIFGEIVNDSNNLKLSKDSRRLQKVALKNRSGKSFVLNPLLIRTYLAQHFQ